MYHRPPRYLPLLDMGSVANEQNLTIKPLQILVCTGVPMSVSVHSESIDHYVAET